MLGSHWILQSMRLEFVLVIIKLLLLELATGRICCDILRAEVTLDDTATYIRQPTEMHREKSIFAQAFHTSEGESGKNQLLFEKKKLLGQLQTLVTRVRDVSEDSMVRRKTKTKKTPPPPLSEKRTNTHLTPPTAQADPKMACLSDSVDSTEGSIDIADDSAHLVMQSQSVMTTEAQDVGATAGPAELANQSLPNLSFYPTLPVINENNSPVKRIQVLGEKSLTSTPKPIPKPRGGTPVRDEREAVANIANPVNGKNPEPDTDTPNVPHTHSAQSASTSPPPPPAVNRPTTAAVNESAIDEQGAVGTSTSYASVVNGVDSVKTLPETQNGPRPKPPATNPLPQVIPLANGSGARVKTGSSRVQGMSAVVGSPPKTRSQSQAKSSKGAPILMDDELNHINSESDEGDDMDTGDSLSGAKKAPLLNDNFEPPISPLLRALDKNESKTAYDLIVAAMQETMKPVAVAVNYVQREVGDLAIRGAENSGKIRQLDARQSHTELKVAKLNRQVNTLEIREKACTLFFDRVPEGAQTPKQAVMAILNDKLNMGLKPEAIHTCFRAGAATGERRPILVRFADSDTKDKVYKMRKEFKTKAPGIYIREHLTEVNRNILQKAKLLKGNGIHNTWTIGGIVNIQINPGNRPIKIYNIEDLPPPCGHGQISGCTCSA